MSERFYVEIRPHSENEDDPGYRRMGPTTLRDAERIDRGANINLNHREYYTRIVSVPEVSNDPS